MFKRRQSRLHELSHVKRLSNLLDRVLLDQSVSKISRHEPFLGLIRRGNLIPSGSDSLWLTATTVGFIPD